MTRTLLRMKKVTVKIDMSKRNSYSKFLRERESCTVNTFYFVYVFSLQRLCEQLHLHTVGKPEAVRITKKGNREKCKMLSVYMTMCVCVCRSSTGRPDWTCVVVGFTSGYVRFYTEVPPLGLQCFVSLCNNGIQQTFFF